MTPPRSLFRYATLTPPLSWWSARRWAPAELVGYVLGLVLSYLLNRRWSFESEASHGRDLPRFLFSYGAGFLATLVFIVVLTRWMRPEIAQVFNVGLTAMVIYLCLRLTGFGKAKASHAD